MKRRWIIFGTALALYVALMGMARIITAPQAACSTEAQPDNATVKGVTWSSRQPDIATVDENGLVTGVKKGTVTISAKAQDGSGATASVKLTVAQKAESLTLKETAVVVLTRRYVTLVAQVLPKNTDNKKTPRPAGSFLLRIQRMRAQTALALLTASAIVPLLTASPTA